MAKEIKNRKYGKRKIDLLTRDAYGRAREKFVLVAKKEIKAWKAFFFLAVAMGIAAGSIFIVQIHFENQSRAETISFMIQRMKTRGCIADGLLTGSGGDTAGAIAPLRRSKL